MESKFHAALTERQRDIAFTALSLIDVDRYRDFTVEEIAETLKLLAPPTEPTVENIPVLLTAGGLAPVGHGLVAGDRLFIEVDKEEVVDRVTKLATAGDIAELYLGIGFPAAMAAFPARPAYSERTRSADLALTSARRQEARERVEARSREEAGRAQSMKNKGYSNAAIAQQLGLAESTVRTILED